MTQVEGNTMVLLTTKLNVPPVRPSHVQRVELLETLDKLRDHRLALIVASAGYGGERVDRPESVEGGLVFD